MILFDDILKSEKHRLWSNPHGLGFFFFLNLRSGGKWLSLELNWSQEHLSEDAVTESPEHWGITMDVLPTLKLVRKKYMLTL